MSRALFVVGTRPEAIKLAPVVLEQRDTSSVVPVILNTMQQGSLADEVLDAFGLRADIHLNGLPPSAKLEESVASMVLGIADVIRDYEPGVVIVQGDTSSAFAGSLAAFSAQTPLAHVEAGLRTYDRSRPFPEEGFRQLIARLATLHFAPTQSNFLNLLSERVREADVVVTGNTVIDALSKMNRRLTEEVDFCNLHEGRLTELLGPGWKEEQFFLVTLHRRESHGQPIEDIARGVTDFLDENPLVTAVWPLHPNPKVADPLRQILGQNKRIKLTRPFSYPEVILMMKFARLVLTDSGGIQEEAPFFGTPVLVARDTTERTEGVEVGSARTVGTTRSAVHHALAARIRNFSDNPSESFGVSPYGDGLAARRIVSALSSVIGET